MANDEVNEPEEESEWLSPFMVAYLADDQDEEVLLEGRTRVITPPPLIVEGDLVRDEGRYKQVRKVAPSGDGSRTYVWFLDGTPGHNALDFPGKPGAMVWRLLSAVVDDS
jgi:hypothetical protein